MYVRIYIYYCYYYYHYYMIIPFASRVFLKRDAYERYRTSSVFTACTTRRDARNPNYVITYIYIYTHVHMSPDHFVVPSHRHYFFNFPSDSKNEARRRRTLISIIDTHPALARSVNTLSAIITALPLSVISHHRNG